MTEMMMMYGATIEDLCKEFEVDMEELEGKEEEQHEKNIHQNSNYFNFYSFSDVCGVSLNNEKY